MTPLSAVIITFNEERNIRRCITSLRQCVDEIIVLDSGSVDQTEALCRELQARFYTQPFNGYTEQKNAANALASYDWIIALDADEQLDDECIAFILASKKEGFRYAIQWNRLTNYCGQWIYHSKWYPDPKIRLFNRKEAAWAGGLLHERVEQMQGGGPVLQGKGLILHYSYYTPEELWKKSRQYGLLAAREQATKPHPPPFWKKWINPLAKFVNHYLLHQGFLDGKAGYDIARAAAYATWLKYGGA